MSRHAHRSSVRLDMAQHMQSVRSASVSETDQAMHVLFQQPRAKNSVSRSLFFLEYHLQSSAMICLLGGQRKLIVVQEHEGP